MFVHLPRLSRSSRSALSRLSCSKVNQAERIWENECALTLALCAMQLKFGFDVSAGESKSRINDRQASPLIRSLLSGVWFVICNDNKFKLKTNEQIVFLCFCILYKCAYVCMYVCITYIHMYVFGYTRTRSHESKMSVGWQRSSGRSALLPVAPLHCSPNCWRQPPTQLPPNALSTVSPPSPLPLFPSHSITCSVAFVVYCELIYSSRSHERVRTFAYPVIISSVVKKKMAFTFSSYSIFSHRFYALIFVTFPIKGLPWQRS